MTSARMSRPMATRSFVWLNLALSCGVSTLAGQVPSTGRGGVPAGFTLALGAGPYAVRDEYISRDRYAGTLSYVRASWTHVGEGRGYRLGLGYGGSSEIANHRVFTGITHAALNLDYFHRASRFRFLSRDAELFLGPSGGLSLYVNEPELGDNAFNLIVSFAAMLSAGVNAQVVLPLSDRLVVNGNLRSTVLSLALRMVDLVEDDESPVALLAPWAGFSSTIGLDARYSLLDHVWLGVGYELAVLRIRSWDPVASAGDNLFVQVTLSR
jgi:hypothetical protein